MSVYKKRSDIQKLVDYYLYGFILLGAALGFFIARELTLPISFEYTGLLFMVFFMLMFFCMAIFFSIAKHLDRKYMRLSEVTDLEFEQIVAEEKIAGNLLEKFKKQGRYCFKGDKIREIKPDESWDSYCKYLESFDNGNTPYQFDDVKKLVEANLAVKLSSAPTAKLRGELP